MSLSPPLTPLIDTATGTLTEIGRIYLRTLGSAVGALAPIDAQYWLSTPATALTNERNLGALASGYLKLTTGGGIAVPSTVTTLPQVDITGLVAALAAIPTTAVQVLNRQASDVANSGTAETTLKTYNLAAGKLANDGDSVRVECAGIAAANANSKTYRLYFGGTVVAINTEASATHVIWRIWAEITRKGATLQIAIPGEYAGQVTGALYTASAPTETLAGAITLKMTGQSAVTGNDITAQNWVVSFWPNA